MNKIHPIIPYIPALFPNENQFKNILKLFKKENIDIVEIGIPYSDPYLDGKIISKVLREMDNKYPNTLNCIKEAGTILKMEGIYGIAMMYYETYQNLSKDIFTVLKEYSYHSIFIPNIRIEDEHSIRKKSDEYGIKYSTFIPYNSSNEMIEKKISFATDFIYIQSYDGVTGSIFHIDELWFEKIKDIVSLAHSKNIKSAIGFGIQEKSNVIKALSTGCDWAIIGSRIVSELEKGFESFIEYINSFEAI